MNDYLPALNEAFGPAGAIVIFALTAWGLSERKGKHLSQESRISENRNHARELYETLGIISQFKAVLESRK